MGGLFYRPLLIMKTRLLLIILLLCLLSGLNAWARPLSLAAPGADVVVYDDALRGDWQNWSWDTQANFSAASPVHSGASAIAVTYSAGWAGLQLGDYNHAEAGAYDTLRFWIHGGSSGGQPVQVQISNGADLAISQSVTPVANSWTKVEISLLGLANRSLYTLVWSNNSAGSQPVFYLDDIAFVNRAQEEKILLVPGTGFGAPGYFRIAYCIDIDIIRRSFPAWERLAKTCGL